MNSLNPHEEIINLHTEKIEKKAGKATKIIQQEGRCKS